jgi:hypothetical protein
MLARIFKEIKVMRYSQNGKDAPIGRKKECVQDLGVKGADAAAPTFRVIQRLYKKTTSRNGDEVTLPIF